MKVLFIIGLTFVFLGCSGARITPDLAAPKCDAVEAHLIGRG
jgi:hypothetical protein